jgi:hypothetical protein
MTWATLANDHCAIIHVCCQSVSTCPYFAHEQPVGGHRRGCGTYGTDVTDPISWRRLMQGVLCKVSRVSRWTHEAQSLTPDLEARSWK